MFISGLLNYVAANKLIIRINMKENQIKDMNLVGRQS